MKKVNEEIKNRIIRGISNLFEHDYHKPIRESNFWSNNYIEYKSNSDRNKALSVEEYLKKIRS